MSNPMIEAMRVVDTTVPDWRTDLLRAALESVPHKGDLWKHENPESICPGCAARTLLDWMEADDD